MQAGDHDEILRVRDRLHKVEALADACLWRVQELEKRCRRIESRLDWCEKQIKELTTAEMIADAVADKLNERTTLQLTVVQKAAAAVVGAIALAASLHGLGVF